MRRVHLPAAILGLVVLVGLAPGSVVAQVPQPVPSLPQTPSLVVDPDQPGATPHWTLTLFAPYCGGYRVGDGVYVSPEQPLALPGDIPFGSVLFAGQPATVSKVGGALRVELGPGVLQSMVCLPGDRPLSIELLPQAGMALPDAPGTYAVDYWTGMDQTPVTLSFEVPARDAAAFADGASD